MAILSRFVALSVSLTPKVSLFQDYGCSNVNFAVVTQNKPLLVFMAESGADLSMACAGRTCSRSPLLRLPASRLG